MDKTPYMYLFIRQDLSPPQQIVQTAHAVDELNKWYKSGKDTNHMVLFPAKHEDDLRSISERLERLGIEHEMFYEPDISAYTAIATRPLIGDERVPLRKYRLMQ